MRSTSWCTRRVCADGARRVLAVAEVVRVAGGPATRVLYDARPERPRWRPPATGRVAEALGEWRP